MNNILATLREIAEGVMQAAEAGELEEVLLRIARVSRRIVGAKYAALGVPDGKGSLAYFKVAGISDEAIARIPHLPEGKGLLGVIMDDRITLRLKKMQEDSRSVGFPNGHPEMTSLLGTPIQVGAQLFGMLYLCDRIDGNEFSEEDAWLVEMLAGYAALAIAGVYLSDQNGRITLLEERERVAMELHDGIIQSLYAVGMQLQLLRLSHASIGSDVASTIENLDEIIEDIRKYIYNLKTTNYQRQSLLVAFSDLVARLHVPEDITIQLDLPDAQAPLSAAGLEAVCQIAYEVISNAIRHADAHCIRVHAPKLDSPFTLRIEDDGQGFDLAAIDNHDGLGLRNIRQRARLNGGQVTIESAPGEGTQVQIIMPPI
jgi:signal transduction histidine kinase